MKHLPACKIIFSAFLLICVGSASAASSQRFTGEGNGATKSFGMPGAWTLRWSNTSDVVLLSYIELRLYDTGTGNLVGTIAQLEGTGSGYKLFENGGDYRIDVVARNSTWELEVSAIDEDRAQEMKKSPGLVRESSFQSWRPADESTLLLFSSDDLDWRVTFAVPCPGLEQAKSISFVTPVSGSLQDYDSILLDNGSRCYFARVEPTSLD